ncbi:MAG TPA: hypothetical protein VGE22_07685, partial [Solimonas sp.]
MIHGKIKSAALVAALFFPALAQAHSFGRIYNLPVPLWLYLYGAAGALLLSFLVVGYFVTVSEAKAPQPQRDLSDSALARRLRHSLPLLKTLS